MTSPQSTSPRPSSARTRSVLAPVLASLLLGTALAGCADAEPDTATDPQGTTTSSTTPEVEPSETSSETPSETTGDDSGSGMAQPVPATGSAGVAEATVVSATEAGGSASTLAFVLDTEQAREDFAAQFERDFGDTVLAQLDAQQTPAGALPYGAIAAVGCDAPESVRIDAGEAGLEVTPELPAKTVQCLAPMTFVVIFAASGA